MTNGSSSLSLTSRESVSVSLPEDHGRGDVPRRLSTPWGAAQTISPIGPGVISVSTAGHGGMRVEGAARKRVQAMFPGFVPFSGHLDWFEEDCDVYLVVVALQELFTLKAQEAASRYLATEHAREYLKRRGVSVNVANDVSHACVVCREPDALVCDDCQAFVCIDHESPRTRNISSETLCLRCEAKARG